MVNISYPFLATEGESDNYLTKAKTYTENDLKGKFVPRFYEKGVLEIFLYEFQNSLEANKAKLNDFTVMRVTVDTDKLLPPIKERGAYVCIDIRMVPISEVVKATHQIFDDVKCLIDSTPTQDFGKDQVATRLDELREARVNDVSMLRGMQVPEIANNKFLSDIVTQKARDMGYMVTTNKSSLTGTSSKASKYFLSRPDLVLYHPDKCHGCVIIAEESSETQSDETPSAPSSPQTRVILKAGLTEKKPYQNSSDTLGQLLAGMEKVAGDMTWMHLTHGGISLKVKVFEQIELFGLIVNFEQLKCQAYKLKMEFDNNRSTLYAGNEELELNQAINRLLATLEEEF